MMSRAWTLASNIMDEMERQLKANGTKGFSVEDLGLRWEVLKLTTEEDKLSRLKGILSKSATTKHQDEDDDMDKNTKVDKRLRINLNKFRDDKYTTIYIETTFGGKSKSLSIQMSLLDHLRPTVFRLKRLIKRVRFDIIEHNTLALDRQLAEIIPERVDDILLGGDENLRK